MIPTPLHAPDMPVSFGLDLSLSKCRVIDDLDALNFKEIVDLSDGVATDVTVASQQKRIRERFIRRMQGTRSVHSALPRARSDRSPSYAW